jgi:hypothetical protein
MDKEFARIIESAGVFDIHGIEQMYTDDDDIRWSETPNEQKRINKPVIEIEPVGDDDWAKEMEERTKR